MNILKNRKEKLIITSPISGYIENVYSQDTLMTIINLNEIILQVPVRITDLKNIDNIKVINIYFPEFKKYFMGSLITRSNEVKMLNNQQAVFVSIKLNNEEEKFLPGMIIDTEINIKKISVAEYIKRLLSS